jgi:alkylmercury lyase
VTQDPLQLDFSNRIARTAFRMLLDKATAVSAESLSERGGWTGTLVTETLLELQKAGRAELDKEKRVIGVFGLTLKPTEHRLELGGRQFFVWCAFDSVGIPAALGESARVWSRCAQCGRELNLKIDAGRPPDLPLVISWLSQKCDSVRDEFCPAVNFYCDEEHYKQSIAAGASAGSFLTLEEAAAIGSANWGWAIDLP